jgi:alanyl-tRNA synthetase
MVLKEGDDLPGETAFKLYDTYGFPLDLTEDALREKGMGVDQAGFDAAMERQRAEARASGFKSGDAATEAVWFALKETLPDTDFTGYAATQGEGALIGLVAGEGQADALSAGDVGALVFDQTPFYAEGGGQIGDAGEIRFENGAVFRVDDVQKRAGVLYAHIGELVSGEIKIGDKPPSSLMRSAGRRPAPTTPPPTCSTPRCATCSARTSPRRAAMSVPTGCALTSPTPRP